MPQSREAGVIRRAHGVEEAAPLAVSGLSRVVVSLVFAAAFAVAVVEATRAVGVDPARPEIVDFHAFYLAGQTAWQGRFALSYDVPFMQALQRSFGGGREVFMPFFYPPPFGLVMAPLALLPVGAALALFTASTLAFYLAVLRRLAGPWFWPAALTVAPVLLIDIRLGQNGLLTGGLAGLAAVLGLERRPGRAGLAAGALAFKPQIATMLPLLFALRREWGALWIAAAAAAVFTAVSILALGVDAVPAFLSSTAFVADFMATGAFPLHRMVSVYACALSLGASPRLAMAAHGVVALGVVAAATVAARRLGDAASPEPRSAAGAMVMATAFVSPYFYDYDLPVFGAGLALALPGLARRLSSRRLVALLIGIAGAGAAGLACNGLMALGVAPSVSLGGPLLLACLGVVLGTFGLRRPSPRWVPGSTVLHPGANG